MSSFTESFLPSTARIQSQGKTTFTARSVTRVPPSSGCAFLNRAERIVQCQDQNSSGPTCKVSRRELANEFSEIAAAHHFSNFAGSSPWSDQPEARASRRWG